MAITEQEREERRTLESLARAYVEAGRVIEAEERAAIREQALAAFTKELDGKLANLQEGESLMVKFRVEILQPSGKIRGGSGAQRNMPEYIEWRSKVYERDGYTCQECGAKGKLNAHHVKPWAHYPDLRFEVDNGVTLCVECHKSKHGHLRMQRGKLTESDD